MPDLDLRALKSLQLIYRRSESVFTVSAAARDWLQLWNLGQPHAQTQWRLSAQQRVLLREMVLKKSGVDLQTADFAGLTQQSRIEAAQQAHNEKLSQRPVRQARVAIKALPQRPLLLSGREYYLPLGACLDWAWTDVLASQQHTTILLVENWEAFERLHHLQFDLSEAGDNPLVVFRGAAHVYPLNASHELLTALALPVYAFMDIDPEGLVMALALPHFKTLVLPPEIMLAELLQSGVNHQRYLEQLPQAQAVLANCEHALVSACWQRLNALGAALPQEVFYRK